VYTAVQSGVVDGLDSPVINIVDNKFYEVTKYVTKAGVIDTTLAFTMNKKLYDGLTAPQRKAVEEAAKVALEFGNQRGRDQTANTYETLRQKGIEINELDTAPLLKAVAPMYDEFVQKNGGKEYIDMVAGLRDK
jgi:TRAP-type transport system periplasmic protein